MKRYLLFGGVEYYACGGFHDFIASYDTLSEAIGRGQYLSSDERSHRDQIEWWHVFDMVTHKICQASGCAHMAGIEVPTLRENR